MVWNERPEWRKPSRTAWWQPAPKHSVPTDPDRREAWINSQRYLSAHRIMRATTWAGNITAVAVLFGVWYWAVGLIVTLVLEFNWVQKTNNLMIEQGITDYSSREVLVAAIVPKSLSTVFKSGVVFGAAYLLAQLV